MELQTGLPKITTAAVLHIILLWLVAHAFSWFLLGPNFVHPPDQNVSHLRRGMYFYLAHSLADIMLKFDRIYFSVNWLETLSSWLFPDWTQCTLGNGELWGIKPNGAWILGLHPSAVKHIHIYLFGLEMALRCGWVMMHCLLWHTWDAECLLSSLEWRPKASFFFLTIMPWGTRILVSIIH